MAFTNDCYQYSIGSTDPYRRLRDLDMAAREVAASGIAIMAQDSAADTFREACNRLGVNTHSVYPSALPAVFRAARHRQRERGPSIAMDFASSASFATMFPDASRIQNLG